MDQLYLPTIFTNYIYHPEERGILENNKTVGKLLRYEFTKDQAYLGEVVDNKAHGHGVFHFKECLYGGHWKNGMERIGY